MKDNIISTPRLLPQDILYPNDVDILCGSGKSVSKHPGNKRFRAIVAKHYEAYESTSTKKEKMKVTHKVMEEILFSASSQTTRFLKKDPIFDKFYVTKKRVGRDKVSHCLRELKIERGRCARVKRHADAGGSGQILQILRHQAPNKNDMPIDEVHDSPSLESPDDYNKASTQVFASTNAFGYGADTSMKNSMDANHQWCRITTDTVNEDSMLNMPATFQQVTPSEQITSQIKYQDQAMTPLERLCRWDSENDLTSLLLPSGAAHHRMGTISQLRSAAAVQTKRAKGRYYTSAFPAGSTDVQQDTTIPRFGDDDTDLFHISPIVLDNPSDLPDKAVHSQEQKHGVSCAAPSAAPNFLQYHALSLLQQQDTRTASPPPSAALLLDEHYDDDDDDDVVKLKLLIKKLTAQVY